MLLYVAFFYAVTSVLIFFWFQFLVIMNLIGISTKPEPFSLGQGIGDEKSFEANLLRFLSGEIFPKLRRRWAFACINAFFSGLLFLITISTTQQ